MTLKDRLIRMKFVRVDGLPYRSLISNEEGVIRAEMHERGKFWAYNSVVCAVTSDGQVWTRYIFDESAWALIDLPGLSHSEVRVWCSNQESLETADLLCRFADPDWEPAVSIAAA